MSIKYSSKVLNFRYISHHIPEDQLEETMIKNITKGYVELYTSSMLPRVIDLNKQKINCFRFSIIRCCLINRF